MPIGAPNYLTGKTGFITIGPLGAAANPFRMQKWQCPMKSKIIVVTNFLSNNYQEVIPAILSSTISSSAYYDAGNMPLSVGTTVPYMFTLGWTTNLFIEVNAYIESLEPDNDAEGAPMIKFSAQSTGAFVASVF